MPEDRASDNFPPPLTAKWWWLFGICTAVLAFVVVGVALENSGGSDYNPPAYVPPVAVHDSDVESVCHDRVLDLLKAPSTAQFSGDKVVGFGDNWTDVGFVDSENSFSAMIRNTYTCTAIHTGGLNWRVKVTGIQ